MELYLDQVGSLLSGPYSVGDVVVKLQPPSNTGLRSVSLLDLEKEGTTIDPDVPISAADARPTPAPAKVVAKVADAPGATLSAQPSKVPEDSAGKRADVVVAETREGSARAEAALMGEDAQGDGQYRFDELGGILLRCPINFQGPDIDPYLPWVREVDVATMMATLSHEIEFGSAGVPLLSQGTSLAVKGQQLEKEFFDIKGISVCFL